jgi:soluble lytic murein transglycosylase-like protein
MLEFDRIWSVLDNLGPYDTRSGWAIWLLMRRARDLAPLPDDVGEMAGRVIATAGKLWLTADEFAALGLPADLEAGLGALLLDRSDLAAHFRRFPAPPIDGRQQGYWLRGQRRLDGSPAAVERLAALPGLKDGHRMDLWRRASEARLRRTEWSQGLADLERGLALVESDASAGMRARLREWAVQALALALAEQRLGDAARVVELAEAAFVGSDREEFRIDAAGLRARLGADDPVPLAWRDQHAWTVRHGRSPEVGSRPPLVLPATESWRHDLWAAWARWGLALAAGNELSPADAAYRDGLVAVRAAEDPVQRHALGCSVAANRLRGSRIVEPLLDFALQRDLERVSGHRALPMTSPIDGLRRGRRWSAVDDRLHWHAVMGACLALGDDRGLLAVAVRLPAAGASEQTVLSFWYPLPSDPAVRRALAAVDLPPELVLAIARNESLFEPAIRSRAGALGFMQIMPFHYADPAGAPGDDHWSHPETSIRAGARILASEVRAHDGDPYRAVAAYNAGRGAVRRWEKQLRDVPDRDLFWAWIGYPETRGYTLRVLRDREVYRDLISGGP